uniref:Uncharacterized protein n=1 Tax=Acrobeloides nanus TaxID=290746 RepID=A0A914EH86_9BILA
MAIFEMNYKEKLNVLVHNFSTHTAFQALLYFIGWIVLLLIYLIDSSEEAKLENLDRDFVIATATLLAYTLLTTCASCAKKTWSIFVAYLFYFVFTILAIFALGILSFGLAVDDHWEASKSTGIFVLVLIYIVILTFYLASCPLIITIIPGVALCIATFGQMDVVGVAPILIITLAWSSVLTPKSTIFLVSSYRKVVRKY